MLFTHNPSPSASSRPFGGRGRIAFAVALFFLLAASAVEAFVADQTASSDGLRLAYLDPGTGSLIIQVIAASLAAAAVVLRTYWHKIKSLFGGGQTSESTDGDLQASPQSRASDD